MAKKKNDKDSHIRSGLSTASILVYNKQYIRAVQTLRPVLEELKALALEEHKKNNKKK